MTQQPNDFFVSYTRKDAKFAKWIAWQLEQQQYRCVIQAWDFIPGQSFVRRMREALQSSKQMIAVLSDDYFDSQFAQAELEAAFVNSKVVPVRVRKCEIPELYQPSIYIDLVDCDEHEALEILLDGIDACRLGLRNRARIYHKKPPNPWKPEVNGRKEKDEVTEPVSEIKPPCSKLRMLFLGAEADTNLDLKEHYQTIRRGVKKGRYHKAFQFTADLDMTAESLFDRLEEVRPHVFHFTGKQNAGRILIRSTSGGTVAVPESALAGMFRRRNSGVRLVVFDTCDCLRSARQVAKTVDAAIGVPGLIYNTESMVFYERFYQTLASGRSLQECWEKARDFAEWNQVPKSHIPTLCPNPDMDPAKIYLVGRKRP